MSIRASRSPSRAPAFLLRPPGPPRSNGSPAGATASPGSFPYSRPRARREAARSERCPHISRAGGRPAQTFPPSCSFPVSSRLVSNTRGGRATLSAGLLPSPPRFPCAFHVPLPAIRPALPGPRPVLPAPRPAPHARVRSYSNSSQAPVRVRSLSRRNDFALGLPRPRRSRARREDAALLPGRARALLRPRPAPPRASHKERPRSGFSSRAGGVGEGPSRSLCSRHPGAPYTGVLKARVGPPWPWSSRP